MKTLNNLTPLFLMVKFQHLGGGRPMNYTVIQSYGIVETIIIIHDM